MLKVPFPLMVGFIGILIALAVVVSFLFPESIFTVLIGAGFVLGLSAAVLKKPEIGVLALLFFLPFERMPTAALFNYTVKINHAVGLLTLLAWGLHLVLGKKHLARPRTFPWGLVLAVALGISAYFAQNRERAVAVFFFIVFAQLLGQAVFHLMQNKTIVRAALRILVVGSAVVAAYALYQFAGDIVGLPSEITGLDPGYTHAVFGFPRVHAFSKEPLYFANYLFIPLGIFTGLILNRVDFQAPKGFGLLYIAMILVFFLSLSRGAFVGAAMFLIVLGVLAARRIFTMKILLTSFWGIAITVGLLAGILSQVGENSLERFVSHATISDFRVTRSGESAFGRLKAYGQAIEAWQTSPLIGIGPGNFGPYVEGYPDEPPVTGWDIVNNQYLELLAEGGLFALGAFLLLIAVMLMRALRAYYHETDSLRRGLLIGLISASSAVLVQLNFFSTLYIIHLWVLFGLLGAITTWSLREARQ